MAYFGYSVVSLLTSIADGAVVIIFSRFSDNPVVSGIIGMGETFISKGVTMCAKGGFCCAGPVINSFPATMASKICGSDFFYSILMVMLPLVAAGDGLADGVAADGTLIDFIAILRTGSGLASGFIPDIMVTAIMLLKGQLIDSLSLGIAAVRAGTGLLTALGCGRFLGGDPAAPGVAGGGNGAGISIAAGAGECFYAIRSTGRLLGDSFGILMGMRRFCGLIVRQCGQGLGFTLIASGAGALGSTGSRNGGFLGGHPITPGVTQRAGIVASRGLMAGLTGESRIAAGSAGCLGDFRLRVMGNLRRDVALVAIAAVLAGIAGITVRGTGGLYNLGDIAVVQLRQGVRVGIAAGAGIGLDAGGAASRFLGDAGSILVLMGRCALVQLGQTLGFNLTACRAGALGRPFTLCGGILGGNPFPIHMTGSGNRITGVLISAVTDEAGIPCFGAGGRNHMLDMVVDVGSFRGVRPFQGLTRQGVFCASWFVRCREQDGFRCCGIQSIRGRGSGHPAGFRRLCAAADEEQHKSAHAEKQNHRQDNESHKLYPYSGL